MIATIPRAERRHRRFFLEKSDGVYCIITRASSAGKTITLPAMDFSESGFRFAAVSQMIRDVAEGEKLFLKAIVGSRNLAFKDPLELEIRWRKYDISRTWVMIGCEIVAISPEAKVQFSKFIEAEEMFRGISHHSLLNGGRPKMDSTPKSEGSGKVLPKSSNTVLILSGGSPRNGSLETVLNWVEDTLQVSGAHCVERVNLFDKAVNGCDGCGQCHETTGCHIKDDIQWVLDKLIACDVAIYASPLYCWGFSSQLKALIDRCHCLFRPRNDAPKQPLSNKNQRQALIVTTPDPFGHSAEPLLTVFHRMLGRYKAQSAGVLFVCNCDAADALGENIKSQSVKFAENLLSNAGKPYPVLIPGDS